MKSWPDWLGLFLRVCFAFEMAVLLVRQEISGIMETDKEASEL